MKLKRIKIPGWVFSPSTANRTARKGLTKYALESRLVPFTEGVLNAIIGLKLFYSKEPVKVDEERNAAFIIANYKRSRDLE